MDTLTKWIKHSSPIVKMTMAIALTSGLVATHKMFYSPYTRKKRLQQAEEWANSIIEQEERMKQSDKDNL